MDHKKRLLPFSLFLLSLVLLMAVSAGAAPKKKLVTKNGYTVYYDSRGKLVKNKMMTIKKYRYAFDSQGHMRKSELFQYQKKTYYAQANGTLAKSRFVTLKDGKRFYFDSNYRKKTGWITKSGRKYYVPSSGTVYKNCWKKIGKYYYYFTSGTYVAKSKWVDGYYVDDSGHRTGKRLSQNAIDTNSQRKTLKMSNLKQNPELPTGCESVALTMALRYHGFSLSKTTIASRYLPRNSTNFVTAFAGNPFSYSGCGIYAPGLANTANKFLKAKKSRLKAYDVSGMDLEDLYKFIDEGVPVVVWNSMYMREPIPSFTYYTKGKNWTFFTYEHCVVLCGYDKKAKKVLINDPLSGKVWRKTSSFKRIYNKMGKMAVVIR